MTTGEHLRPFTEPINCCTTRRLGSEIPHRPFAQFDSSCGELTGPDFVLRGEGLEPEIFK